MLYERFFEVPKRSGRDRVNSIVNPDNGQNKHTVPFENEI
jgi:hypothetical protein